MLEHILIIIFILLILTCRPNVVEGLTDCSQQYQLGKTVGANQGKLQQLSELDNQNQAQLQKLNVKISQLEKNDADLKKSCKSYS